jgi:hypothetical protein
MTLALRKLSRTSRKCTAVSILAGDKSRSMTLSETLTETVGSAFAALTATNAPTPTRALTTFGKALWVFMMLGSFSAPHLNERSRSLATLAEVFA